MRYCLISNIGPHYRWAIYDLISKEFDCDFYFGKNETIYDTVKLFDYNKLRGYKKTLKNKYLFGPLWYQKGMTKLVFKKYDAFVLPGAPFCLSTWTFLVLSKLLGKKTVAWSHGILHSHGGLKKLLYKTYFSLFDRVMTYNERSSKLLIEEGVPEEKLFVIGNSLDTDTHRMLRKELQDTPIFKEHFGNCKPVILYCGRIQKIKKLDILLDAMLLLNKKGIRLNAVLVGADSPDTNIQELVKSRELAEQVWIYGPCYDERKLSEIFYNSDVCVSPGNVGLTAIHSLSFGCPVITNDNFDTQMPEFEAIRKGITGDFFKENDIQDLANVIENWITTKNANKDIVRKNAFEEIENKWNIHCQIEVLKRVFASLE